mmetsp:Transcript_89199/g.139657  ORF Transcript_89199/g.139657 Transcript_89199/m.139657 type:complete len:120 (+) Transcript_89199:22-381(+)
MVSFTKVADIKPDSTQINTIVKVLTSEVKLQCLGNSSAPRFTEVVVGDETGTVVLHVHGVQAECCKPGVALVVRGARVEMFGGHIRLELGKWSRLRPIEGAAFVPNSERDISGTEFALV